MLGVQGTHGRKACLGRASVARGQHGRWGAGRHGQGRAGRWSAAAGPASVCGRADERGRAAGRAGGRRAGGRRAGRAQQGRSRRAAWALGARPGRLGWPWAVHSVHSAYFRSVLTRFFS